MIPAVAGWLAVALSMPGWSATVLETSELLAATPEAAAQLRPAFEFTIPAAGNYVITLQDLAQPAHLQALQALVTRDLQVVARPEVEYPTPPGATPVSVTETFAATPGVYRVHVLGTIDPAAIGGFYGISVAPAAGGAAVLEQVESVAANGGPGPNQSDLLATFTVPATGTYALDFTDYNFPSTLAQSFLILMEPAVSSTVPVLLAEGPFNATAGDTFELRVVATAGASQAGLYGVSVIGGPSGAVAYRSDNTVGQLPPATTFNVAATGGHTLSLADLDFPEPLTALSAAVTQNGAVAGSTSGEGAATIQLNPGTAQLFVFATPVSTGAMSVSVSQGSQVDYADVHIADASSDAGTPAIYSFTPSQAVVAGNYTLTIADFRFPSQLPALETAVVQGTTVVHQADAAVAETVALQAGTVRVLVAATPPPATGTTPGNGMFGLTLAAQPGGSVVFEGTQGVGGLFNSRLVNLATAGRYDFSLADFEFPKRLRTSWLAITRGTTLVGQIIGSGLIQNEQLEAGTYVLNFLGQPAADSAFGAFGLKVANSAPPPVVTFSASPTSVTSGQQTTLTWSATNATSCTASGGWSGTKTVSGTQQSAALTTNTTFEIECVGPSGRDDASVTVTVNAPSPNGGGGGGHVDPLLLLCLSIMLAAKVPKYLRRAATT